MTWRAIAFGLVFAVVAMVSLALVERGRERTDEPVTAAPMPEASPRPSSTVAEASDPKPTELPAAEAFEPDEEEPLQVSPEEGTALVRPLLGAIRGRFASDGERRDAMLQALDRSGPSSEPWTAYAASTLDGLRHAMREVPGVEVDARHTSCFRAGCMARVLFRDESTYRRASEAFRSLNEDAPQHGGRVQTPAVPRPDGSWEGHWILLRPT